MRGFVVLAFLLLVGGCSPAAFTVFDDDRGFGGAPVEDVLIGHPPMPPLEPPVPPVEPPEPPVEPPVVPPVLPPVEPPVVPPEPPVEPPDKDSCWAREVPSGVVINKCPREGAEVTRP